MFNQIIPKKFELIQLDEIFSTLPNDDPYLNGYNSSTYAVSNYGRLMNINRDKIVKPFITKNGFSVIKMMNNSSGKVFNIDMLVLLAFDYRYDCRSINLTALHLNWNNGDNRLCNLAWSDGLKFGKRIFIRPAPIPINAEYINGEHWSPIPPIEEFKLIDGNNYLVSDYGRVYSLHFNRLVTQCLDKDGYLAVTLAGKKRISVHRLVMLVFNYHPLKEFLHVNHIDGDHTNNKLSNLEWVTPRENITHSIVNNFAPTIGEKMWLAKNDQAMVFTILDYYYNNKLSPNDIDYLLGLGRDYSLRLVTSSSRVMDVIIYLESKGIDIKSRLPQSVINIIKDNCNINRHDFNNIIIDGIGIDIFSYDFTCAHILKCAFMDENSWIYRKIFIGK